MHALLWLIHEVIELYSWVIIGSVILSWLITFRVVNANNRFVYSVGEFLYRLSEPVMRPIRRFMPNLGGIDISPVIVLLGLQFLNILIYEYIG